MNKAYAGDDPEYQAIDAESKYLPEIPYNELVQVGLDVYCNRKEYKLKGSKYDAWRAWLRKRKEFMDDNYPEAQIRFLPE